MSRWFITRHLGALEWAQSQGFVFDKQQGHLHDVRCIQPGDCVFGSLPFNLAFAVQERGADYFHLSIEVPERLRGQELTAAMMSKYNAKFEQFIITRVKY
ncbi:CRISPR-associated protein Csx16 [uncultured Shewanella sp.]|uniref:CRISPR-associated protein Csx16 n=1 Tax=uncultured Shewanella sp. TaxID=173975 RepID=UPI00260D8297|nr:CRISPR-associated protein Csx16 [uncultured Shewanella sp.]